ncbi:MAG: alpha/beta hydrolase [Hyphomicrobiales bacterium]|nr:MAG: alpha/beta hydrolase [Hyphomicrobiales bacterium]
MRKLGLFLLSCALVAPAPAAWDKIRPSCADPQSAAADNAVPGPRRVPARVLPVPGDVSLQLQALIRAPYPPNVLAPPPSTKEEWAALDRRFDSEWSKTLAALRKSLKVGVEPTTIAGVKAYLVTPADLPANNRNRLLLHIHGGGYVAGGGEAATSEAIMMAGIGHYRVISVDYRLPPEAPFPAALDDVLAVWDSLAQTVKPQNMAVFGASAGGGLALAMVLRAKDEGLPLPAAVAASTPWSDLNKVGDSYYANEYVDNMLVTWDGWLSAAAQLYANGRDLKHPYLSPVYGDFKNFPPTILTAGTRDLFLSNAVRVHRKMRRAGVVADLNVYEGMSHAQYAGPDMPESREIFEDITRFFDGRLGR